MDNSKLVHMANQIAHFFRSYPEADAVKGIREHLTAFWTPGMRKSLTAQIDTDRQGIETLVVLAMGSGVGQGADHAHGDSPIKKEIVGPGVQGQIVCDAG